MKRGHGRNHAPLRLDQRGPLAGAIQDQVVAGLAELALGRAAARDPAHGRAAGHRAVQRDSGRRAVGQRHAAGPLLAVGRDLAQRAPGERHHLVVEGPGDHDGLTLELGARDPAAVLAVRLHGRIGRRPDTREPGGHGRVVGRAAREAEAADEQQSRERPAEELKHGGNSQLVTRGMRVILLYIYINYCICQ